MIATTVLAAQFAGTLDLSGTTRVGARTSEPVPQVALASTPSGRGRDYLSGDFSTGLSARLRLNNPHWDYSLAYAPALTATNIELGFIPQAFQTGAAAIGWHDKFVFVTLSESGSFGTLPPILFQQQTAIATTTPGATTPGTMTTPGTTTMPGTTPVPGMTTAPGTPAPGATTQIANPSSIELGSSNTFAGLTLRTDPRLSFSLSGGYVINGGLTYDAKAVLPETYGPFAVASVAYAASRRDSVVVTATGQQITTSGTCPPPYPLTLNRCVEHTPIVDLRATLRDQLSGSMNVSLSAGAAGYIIQTASMEEAVIQPVGVATLTNRFGPAGSSYWALSTGLTPSVDLRTGLVSDRLQAIASLAELVESNVTLVLTGGVVQSIPVPTVDPYPISAVNGGADVRVRIDRQIEVGLGLQELWQNQTGYGTLFSTLGYISVIARARTLRF